MTDVSGDNYLRNQVARALRRKRAEDDYLDGRATCCSHKESATTEGRVDLSPNEGKSS